jgi:hypothetical protein
MIAMMMRHRERRHVAVETVAQPQRDFRVAEVTKMDMTVEEGKVTAFRTGNSARAGGP